MRSMCTCRSHGEKWRVSCFEASRLIHRRVCRDTRVCVRCTVVYCVDCFSVRRTCMSCGASLQKLEHELELYVDSSCSENDDNDDDRATSTTTSKLTWIVDLFVEHFLAGPFRWSTDLNRTAASPLSNVTHSSPEQLRVRFIFSN